VQVWNAVDRFPVSAKGKEFCVEELAKFLAEELPVSQWKIVLRTANPTISGPDMPKGPTDAADGQRTLVVHTTHPRTSSGGREGGSEILRNLRHVYILCTYEGMPPAWGLRLAGGSNSWGCVERPEAGS
jgi:hypothetical protein